MCHKGRLKSGRMYSLALESCITSITRVPHPREQLPFSTDDDTGLRTMYLGFCIQISVTIGCSVTALFCQKTVTAAGGELTEVGQRELGFFYFLRTWQWGNRANESESC